MIKQLMPRSQQKGLRQISQTDIGVVTPYRKQRNCLAQKLRRLNFDEITIGTAEGWFSNSSSFLFEFKCF